MTKAATAAPAPTPAPAAARTAERIWPNNIAPLADTPVFNLIAAATRESLETALSPGFFRPMARGLLPWDRIMLTCDCESDEPKHALLVVTAIELEDGTLVRRPDSYGRGVHTLGTAYQQGRISSAHVKLLSVV